MLFVRIVVVSVVARLWSIMLSLSASLSVFAAWVSTVVVLAFCSCCRRYFRCFPCGAAVFVVVVVVVVSGFVSVDDVAFIVVFVAVAVTPVAVLLTIVASDDDVVVVCVFVCVVSVAVVIVVLVMVRLDVVVTVVFVLRLVARIAFVISVLVVFVFAIIFQPKNLHFKLLSSCISFPQNNFDKCYTKLPCSNTVKTGLANEFSITM